MQVVGLHSPFYGNFVFLPAGYYVQVLYVQSRWGRGGEREEERRIISLWCCLRAVA